jgi:PAS domain S-box-containing protein
MINSSLGSRLRAWLNNIPIHDPIERRIASLLQVVLIGLMVIVILATILLVTIPTLSLQEKLDAVISDLFGFLVVALPLSLLRRGYFRGSALIIIIILFITPALAVTVVVDLLNSGGIVVQFTLAIILAGLLVSRRALVLTFGLSALVVGFAAFRGQNAAPQLATANIGMATSFILFNGLIALILDRFGLTLRTTLKTALVRETELKIEINERKQAEEALQKAHDELENSVQERTAELAQTNELLQTLMDSTPDNIFFKDIQGRFLRVSRSQASWFGLDNPALMLGKTDFDFFADEHVHQALADEQIVMRTGRPLVGFEEHEIWPDGRETWVLTTKAPLRDNDGHIVGTFGIARDITERKRAEVALRQAKAELEVRVAERTAELNQANEQLRLELTARRRAEEEVLLSQSRLTGLVTSAMDGIVSIDSQQKIVLFNPAAETMFGYKAEEMLGQPHAILLPERYRAAHARQIDHFGRTGITSRAMAGFTEVTGLRRNGEEFPMDASISQVEVGGQKFFTVILRDVTERTQAEEMLQASEARYRRLFEAAKDGILILDADTGEILDVNPFLKEMLGYSHTQFLGKQLWEIGLFKDIVDNKASFRELQKSRYIRYENLPLETKDGHTIWVEFVSNVYDVNGIQVIQCNIRDITGRKQAEEKVQRQNQRLRVLREIDTAILSSDSVENIVNVALSHIRELIDCHRASMSLFDWGTDEALIFGVRTATETSIPLGTRMPLVLFQDMIQTLSKDQPVVIQDLSALVDPPPQIQSQIRDGLRSMCLLPLFSQNNLFGSFSLFSDIPGFFDEEKINLGREVANQVAIAITQSRLVEVLQHLNVDLEQRVRERENLIAELTAKNAELERFTYAVSHDLKSPLVTIMGFLGYLEQDAMTGNVERLKGDAKRIATAVEKMQELLNDLLELARIGRFVNPPELVPFEELAREAIGLVEGRIQERGVTVDLQSNLPAVYVDKPRLIEVLQNLLDNAAKYMGDQPHPLIEIGTCGEEDDKPIFYVKDNGISIAPEYREKIFGLFDKLDARSEGAGIGLALVKRIIEFHGGRIWVESKAGKGSALCFTLPVA